MFLFQVQNFAMLLTEHHEVHISPSLQLVEVPLDKIVEGAFCLIIQFINEDVGQVQSQY